ncbi:MAG: DUF4198 domain-containing protein [bacterium]
MKKTIVKKTGMILLAVICMVGMVSAAQGHMLWLNASNYTPKAGENVTIDIGFGHKYPHTEAVKEENIERIFIRDPKGQELPIEKAAPAKYAFSPKTEGLYEVVIKMKQGFVSNTPDGRKMGNKKSLPNAVSCFQFTMNAKVLINVGAKASSPSPVSDLPLEMVLPENIGRLKVGDELALKVVYQGKPLAGAKVSATDKNTAQQQEGKWVQESESDDQGMVRMKLTSQGPWLITATHEIPFPDQSECDKSTYRITLTLGLE